MSAGRRPAPPRQRLPPDQKRKHCNAAACRKHPRQPGHPPAPAGASIGLCPGIRVSLQGQWTDVDPRRLRRRRSGSPQCAPYRALRLPRFQGDFAASWRIVASGRTPALSASMCPVSAGGYAGGGWGAEASQASRMPEKETGHPAQEQGMFASEQRPRSKRNRSSLPAGFRYPGKGIRP